MSAPPPQSGPARSIRAALAATALLLVATAGCGALPGTTPSPVAPSPIPEPASSSPTQSPTSSESPTPGSSPSDTSGTPATGTATPSVSGSPTDPSASATPPILDRSAAGRDLKLADFFAAPVEWRDGLYDVGSDRGLAGISGPVRSCTSDEAKAQTFELRLANSFSKISMRIGQANNSENSDAEVLVRLVGNGTFLDSARVKFNKLQDVSVPVSGVNALKIEVFMTGKKCTEDKAVNAVLAGVRVE